MNWLIRQLWKWIKGKNVSSPLLSCCYSSSWFRREIEYSSWILQLSKCASWQKTHRGDILVGLLPSLQGDLRLLKGRKAIYPFCSQCLDFGEALLSAKVIVGVQQQVQILWNVQLEPLSKQPWPSIPPHYTPSHASTSATLLHNSSQGVFGNLLAVAWKI